MDLLVYKHMKYRITIIYMYYTDIIDLFKIENLVFFCVNIFEFFKKMRIFFLGIFVLFLTYIIKPLS